MLNKQSRTSDKGWSYSFGVGRGANNSSASRPEDGKFRKIIILFRNVMKVLGHGLTFWVNDQS
jgi:hypothetical protein